MAQRLVLRDRTVDLETGDVHTDGAPVTRLTTKERLLLAYLAERAPAAASQGELLQAVWGYRPDTATRTVFATVNRLRGKVEAHPDRPVHVLTDRGDGYRFVADSEPAADDEPPDGVAQRLSVFDAPFTDGEAVEVLGELGVGADLGFLGEPGPSPLGAVYGPLPSPRRERLRERLPAAVRSAARRRHAEVRLRRVAAVLELPNPADRPAPLTALEPDLLALCDGDHVDAAYAAAFALCELCIRTGRTDVHGRIGAVIASLDGVPRLKLTWQRGRLLMKEDPPRALADLEDALAVAHRLGRADDQGALLECLADVDASLGEYDRALGRLETVPTVCTRDVRPASCRILALLGRADEALPLAEAAVAEARAGAPGLTRALVFLAEVLHALGRWDDAARASREALAGSLLDATPMTSLAALVQIGESAAAAGRWEEAERALWQARELSGEPAHRRTVLDLLLARVGMAQGRWFEAARLLERREIAAGVGAFHGTRTLQALLEAALLLATGDPREAVGRLERSCGEQDTSGAAATLVRAIAAERAGHRLTIPPDLARDATVDDLAAILAAVRAGDRPPAGGAPLARVVARAWDTG